MRCAVISVGTNSCRLLIATVSADRTSVAPEYHESRGTRVGQGIAPGKLLDPKAADRTLDAVTEYAALARHAERTFAIATSALRDAADADVFARRVRDITGAPLAVLSGDEEARASFDGARAALRAAGISLGDGLTVLDVGGGSTEIARCDGPGQAVQTTSLPLGAVRLTERFLPSDPPTAEELARCRAAIELATAGLAQRVRPRGLLVGVGGTASTAASMLQAEVIDGVARIGTTALAELTRAVAGLAVAHRIRLHGLPAQRADIIVAGLLVFDVVSYAARADEIVVTQGDLLAGYLLEHAGD